MVAQVPGADAALTLIAAMISLLAPGTGTAMVQMPGSSSSSLIP
jgi:hypothetical protein